VLVRNHTSSSSSSSSSQSGSRRRAVTATIERSYITGQKPSADTGASFVSFDVLSCLMWSLLCRAPGGVARGPGYERCRQPGLGQRPLCRGDGPARALLNQYTTLVL
jgi:hypothetical protein